MTEPAIRPRAVLIAGPTASGKSALAVDLAQQAGGVVINADSMQVYSDLRVITARPTAEEEARVPHRLYGHVDGAADYSVAHWLEDVRRELDAAWRRGLLPVVIGGTGLYFRALTEGLSAVPTVPEEIREQVRTLGLDAAALHERLARIDPLTARQLRPSDTQRLMRALEVFEATGRPLAEWQKERGVPGALATEDAAAVFLSTNRTTLRARIAARFHMMMEGGALDEVRALDARGLPPDRTVLKAHGVPWLRRHLRGEISLDEAVEHGIVDTRQYAKRQDTWFRHQLRGWRALSVEDARDLLASMVAG